MGYGQGSGQQIVSCHERGDEIGSLWSVKESEYLEEQTAEENELCQTGKPITCGQVIRLEHVQTGKNLHSHPIPSPLSHKHEVSGYGDDGEGDGGDNWTIECFDPQKQDLEVLGKEVTGSTIIQFRHIETGALLVCDRKYEYNHRNCPRCPIVGQLEATTQNRKSTGVTRWKITSGMFFPKLEDKAASEAEKADTE